MQKLIIIGLIAATSWWLFSSPDTEAVALPNGSYEYPGYQFHNAEPYTLEARVLARENYHFGREAELSPTDLALGWGRMADDDVVSKISVSQRGRWYYWRADQFPIPRSEIQTHSANVHIVPANESVSASLAQIDPHDQVRLTGKLVDITATDGWRWQSSRSRSDIGNGSCELMLVERIELL